MRTYMTRKIGEVKHFRLTYSCTVVLILKIAVVISEKSSGRQHGFRFDENQSLS